MDAEVGYHEETLIQKTEDEWNDAQFAGRVAAEADKIWLQHTQMSGQVDKLFTAMAKAQGEMGHAAKTEKNEFYGSTYADLAACFEAVRQPLFMNGLCLIQSPAGGISHDFPNSVILETLIGHVSGQWISSSLTMRLVRDDPHGVGSAITYARRYALASMLGLAQVDDDGNAATVPAEAPAKKKAVKKKSAKKVVSEKSPTTVLNDKLTEAGCTSTEEADMVCGWLFGDSTTTVDTCRDSDGAAEMCIDRITEVVASGVALGDFLTRAAVWRDGTQEEESK